MLRYMMVAQRVTAVVSDPAKTCRLASPSTSLCESPLRMKPPLYRRLADTDDGLRGSVYNHVGPFCSLSVLAETLSDEIVNNPGRVVSH